MSDNIGVEEAGRQDRQVRSEVEIKLRQLEITTAMSSYTMPALVKHAWNRSKQTNNQENKQTQNYWGDEELVAGGNCEKDTFDNDCHDPILNDATLLMVWFVCCLFDDCQRDSDVEDDSNGGGGNDVDDVGDDNYDDHDDDDDDEVDEASTRSPSSSCSSAQAPPDGSRGHVSASTIQWFYSNMLSKY